MFLTKRECLRTIVVETTLKYCHGLQTSETIECNSSFILKTCKKPFFDVIIILPQKIRLFFWCLVFRIFLTLIIKISFLLCSFFSILLISSRDSAVFLPSSTSVLRSNLCFKFPFQVISVTLFLFSQHLPQTNL